jgi:hypothetical protein
MIVFMNESLVDGPCVLLVSVLVFVPDYPSLNIFVSPDTPVHRNRFDSDFVVREGRHPLTAEALDDEPPMVQAITVHDHAAAKENAHPLTRQEKAVEVMVPKVIVGHEGKQVGAQAEIDIDRQAATKP